MIEPCAEGAEPRVTVRGSCPFDEWFSPPVPLLCFASHSTAYLPTNAFRHRAEPKYGLQIIELRARTIAHWLRMDGMRLTELWVFPSVSQLKVVRFKSNGIDRMLFVDELGDLKMTRISGKRVACVAN